MNLDLCLINKDHESGRKEKRIKTMDDICCIYGNHYRHVNICTYLLLGSTPIPIDLFCLCNGLGLSSKSAY